MPELTVIIPCYNEAKRLSGFFDLIEANRELDWEWLFINDGSKDNTVELIEQHAAGNDKIRLHSLDKNSGKGKAVRTGLLEAKGDIVGFVDADLAASPLIMKRLLKNEKLQDKSSVLIGIRLKTQESNVDRKWYRHYMGRVFQTLVSVISGLTVYDTQCGFKFMHKSLAEDIASKMQCDGFCFDVELLMIANRLGYFIDEQMIDWEEKGDSKVRPWHIVQMFFDILKISKRVRRDVPTASK
ncbi:MAG: glycosyltransferase family 2 protein [Lentisphaeria bacterium]|nr:glycosyltransferase family 2 protein [Lentisphaeria bacterium]NQZ67857.1 glycosyltransferase family 2 protein [Lentisphaeria bacterium]